jgi:hypothetical protein
MGAVMMLLSACPVGMDELTEASLPVAETAATERLDCRSAFLNIVLWVQKELRWTFSERDVIGGEEVVEGGGCGRAKESFVSEDRMGCQGELTQFARLPTPPLCPRIRRAYSPVCDVHSAEYTLYLFHYRITSYRY